LYITRKIISQVVEAAEKTDPILLERRDTHIQGYRLDRLVRAFNKLISENASISHTGEEYLDQIQTTLGNLREAVVMVDSTNTIRLANPAFAELAGVDKNPTGMRMDSFIQGEDFHTLLRDFRESGVGQRCEIEVQMQKRDLWLEVSVANLQENPNSEGPFTLFIFHDITRQKGLERMRTEFVANVSHELCTPVTVIKGFAETLIEDDKILSPDDKIRFLQKIVTNADRQHEILQDLLLLSRLESTEMVLRLEDLSTSGFLKEVSESWAEEMGGKKLEIECGPGWDIIHADPLRLSQVMTNLFQNILRHAGDYSRILMGCVPEEAVVCIFIEDDGDGIPEKDLPHVFQRFYRVEKGRSRELGGTGLGLAIIKHIVGQHGGTILARSTQGEGTRIEIRLPLVSRTPGRPQA